MMEYAVRQRHDTQHDAMYYADNPELAYAAIYGAPPDEPSDQPSPGPPAVAPGPTVHDYYQSPFEALAASLHQSATKYRLDEREREAGSQSDGAGESKKMARLSESGKDVGAANALGGLEDYGDSDEESE